MLTLSIHGMAYVVRRNDAFDVLLDPTMGHQAILNIPTRFLDPNRVTAFPRWDPDSVSFVPLVTEDGLIRMEQIATWALRQRVVTIGRIGGTPGKWNNRQDTITVDVLQYPTPVTTAVPTPPGCTVIRLFEGDLSSEHLHPFTLTQKTTGATINKDCAIQIHLTVAIDAIFSNGMIIQLTEDSGLEQPPFASVSNTAVEANLERAMDHFQVYYDDIVRDSGAKPLPEGQRFTLTHSASDVYDCIPPAGGLP